MPNTVYRTVNKRRTTVPRRSSSATAGMTTGFGRMLAKLALASSTLNATRAKPRR